MNKQIPWFFLLIFFSFLTSSCTRPQPKKSTIKIQFPRTDKNNKSEKAFATDIASNISTGFSGNFPINCYMVMIAGPEVDLQKNHCERKNDPSFLSRRVGVWSGGVSSGGTLELDVPAGSDRTVIIAGFYSQSGFCRDFHKNGFSKGLSRPYILVEVSQVNMPGGQTTEVPANLSFNSELWFDSCVGPDFRESISANTAGRSFIRINRAGAGDVTTTNGQYTGRILVHWSAKKSN